MGIWDRVFNRLYGNDPGTGEELRVEDQRYRALAARRIPLREMLARHDADLVAANLKVAERRLFDDVPEVGEGRRGGRSVAVAVVETGGSQPRGQILGTHPGHDSDGVWCAASALE